jgi:hypothetical protein
MGFRNVCHLIIHRTLAVVVFVSILVKVRAEEFDVLVYGATPAGIAAALSAGRAGDRVLLVDPVDHIGGMVTNGLSHTDFRTFEGLSGLYLEFTHRVEDAYRKKYGSDSAQFRESLHGTNAEPKVNLAVFESMLAEVPKIQLRQNWMLEALRCSLNGNGLSDSVSMRSVEVALFWDAKGERHPIAAHYFVDASYEGDLMFAAGVPYRIGREGRDETGESLAPLTGDDELQGFNYRMIMTQNAANRVMMRRPEGYVRSDFEEILKFLEAGKIPKLFGTSPPAIFKAQIPSLPNGKFDINDVSHGLVRLSLPGDNLAWPDGDAGVAIRNGPERDSLRPPFTRLGFSMARERIAEAHKRWAVGLLYFLQNDESVPAPFRDEARSWGFARDEFSDNHYFPEQLYVREARRMLGEYVFSEKDMQATPEEARSLFHADAVAIGDYGPNCHGTSHQGSRFGGKHAGEFYKAVPPYQIPYGVIVPKSVDNLLVPVAASTTHVGFCGLRYEPIWMSLGEAAGHAAHLANEARSSVQLVNIEALQKRLIAGSSSTVYVSDVLPGQPDFAAVQWWGNMGGLLGLEPASLNPLGRHIVGQYYEAFVGHHAELDNKLTVELRARWEQLLSRRFGNRLVPPTAADASTRGQWIRMAWERFLQL